MKLVFENRSIKPYDIFRSGELELLEGSDPELIARVIVRDFQNSNNMCGSWLVTSVDDSGNSQILSDFDNVDLREVEFPADL